MDHLAHPPLEIKKQGRADECTACAVASIGETVLGKLIDPLYTYDKCRDGQFGIDPEKVCQSVVNDGFRLQSGGEPVKVFNGYRKVFTFPLFLGIFAGIRKVLLDKKKEVFAGCYWQQEWDKISGGVIDGMYQDLKLFPHAFKVLDVTEINGIMYLVVQNSEGSEVGDGGMFYFPESVAKNFRFAYYFI